MGRRAESTAASAAARVTKSNAATRESAGGFERNSASHASGDLGTCCFCCLRVPCVKAVGKVRCSLSKNGLKQRTHCAFGAACVGGSARRVALVATVGPVWRLWWGSESGSAVADRMAGRAPASACTSDRYSSGVRGTELPGTVVTADSGSTGLCAKSSSDEYGEAMAAAVALFEGCVRQRNGSPTISWDIKKLARCPFRSHLVRGPCAATRHRGTVPDDDVHPGLHRGVATPCSLFTKVVLTVILRVCFQSPDPPTRLHPRPHHHLHPYPHPYPQRQFSPQIGTAQPTATPLLPTQTPQVMQLLRPTSRLSPCLASRLALTPASRCMSWLSTQPYTERNIYPLSSVNKPASPILLLEGYADTIGAEVTRSLKRVFQAAGAPVDFIAPKVGLELDEGITGEVSDLFSRTRVAIKGPYFTPPRDAKARSVNIQLRTEFDLFAAVVHAHNFPAVQTRHEDVDIVIIRENTEGEYSGLEHSVVPGVVESLKIITREKSLRIAEYAFEYAARHNRKKVTAVHKANIMKIADGLFLKCCQEVAARYPYIEFESMIVDNTCMQMTSRPQQFDVMLLPNLYGNIITNIASGLIGGPGLLPGSNIGLNAALFEQGTRNAARSLAGQGIANPTATIMSGVLALRYIKMNSAAEAIEQAVMSVFRDTNLRTKDVSQQNDMTVVSNEQFTDAIIEKIQKA